MAEIGKQKKENEGPKNEYCELGDRKVGFDLILHTHEARSPGDSGNLPTGEGGLRSTQRNFRCYELVKIGAPGEKWQRLIKVFM